MKTNENLFKEVLIRLEKFYSYMDLNEFDNSLNPGNIGTVILLYERNQWYQNAIEKVTKQTKNNLLLKTMIEDLKYRIIDLRRLNKKHIYPSVTCLSKEDRNLMHIQLRSLENYLNEFLYTSMAIGKQSTRKGEFISLRGKEYQTLEINQKVVLVHYLSECNLFPSHNSLTTTQDQYVILLAMLFNSGATNIAKHRINFSKKLKEFKKQKESLDKCFPALYRDTIIARKWLKDIGLNEIATKLDNELLA